MRKKSDIIMKIQPPARPVGRPPKKKTGARPDAMHSFRKPSKKERAELLADWGRAFCESYFEQWRRLDPNQQLKIMRHYENIQRSDSSSTKTDGLFEEIGRLLNSTPVVDPVVVDHWGDKH